MSGIVIDAAYPPPAIPPGVTGIMGYIGQRGLADHVWTPQQWSPFASIRQFPVWVPDFSEAPALEGGTAVEAALALGWASHEADTRVIICDMETTINPSWYTMWAATVENSGFAPVCYGSLSTVLDNAADHNIIADWDGIKTIPPGQTIHGVQYAANVKAGGGTVDFDLFDGWLMARGGVGPRHGA